MDALQDGVQVLHSSLRRMDSAVGLGLVVKKIVMRSL